VDRVGDPEKQVGVVVGVVGVVVGVVVSVVVSDEQTDLAIDVDRWAALADAVLRSEGRSGELTLTFVDPIEMAALNAEHMGQQGPTDVLSFPLDADADPESIPADWGPILLGDVVICPAVAADSAPTHAGTLDDELALLTVHGVLHVLGHDHSESDETAVMRTRELELLVEHHWHGPAPTGFTQELSA
jgi:probable rRNA maturation factor